MVSTLSLLGCPGDDGSGETGTMVSTGPAASTETGAPATGSGSDSGGSGSGGGGMTDSSGGMVDSSGGAPACDPQIPGEWNACIGDGGTVDTTQCNWMGLSGTVGFIGCLSSASLEGGNVCMITGCEDTCDCFAPPATGTAEVICSAVLKSGDNACALDCSGGRTCPDGMECAGDLCFWPPA